MSDEKVLNRQWTCPKCGERISHSFRVEGKEDEERAGEAMDDLLARDRRDHEKAHKATPAEEKAEA